LRRHYDPWNPRIHEENRILQGKVEVDVMKKKRSAEGAIIFHRVDRDGKIFCRAVHPEKGLVAELKIPIFDFRKNPDKVELVIEMWQERIRNAFLIDTHSCDNAV